MQADQVDQWPGLLQHDVHRCQLRLPKLVKELLRDPTLNLCVAGGYIRSCIANEPVNDIDLFSSSRVLAELAALRLAPGTPFHKTENAITVRMPNSPAVQFIHRWTFDRPERVIPSFDFTIARAAMWWDAPGNQWRTICDPRFYADLAAKRLIYCSPIRSEGAGGSMLRVLKFYQKGYRIPLDSLGAVIARLTKDVRAEAQTETDIAKVITGLLREVDPSIDPAHVAHLPGGLIETGNQQ
jgi:hypothetical protein